MISERWQRLGGELTERGWDGLLVVAVTDRDPDLATFTGTVHLGHAVVLALPGRTPYLAYYSPMERDGAAATGLQLIPPESLDLVAVVREHRAAAEWRSEWLRRIFSTVGLDGGRLGLAGHAPLGDLVAACRTLEGEGYEFVPGHRLVSRVRKGKTAEELAEIRRAAAGAGQAMARVATLLAAAGEAAPMPGGELWLEGERLTVGRLKDEVSGVLGAAGLEQPEGNLVSPAEEGAVPHNTGTRERVLRAGESLVVDLFPRAHLFADVTRTFCVGEPPEILVRAHAAVREALEAAHDSLRRATPAGGIRGWQLQEETCEILGRAGFPTPSCDPAATVFERGYVHLLGHGVGLALHEQPSFGRNAEEEGLLEVGDVLTLEPGLYEPGQGVEEPGWAVRLEDLVALTPDGPEVLTPWPLDLDPRVFTVTP